MPSLTQSLEGKDLGHIRIVAELWGVEIEAKDALDGIKQISPALLDGDLVQDIFEALPEDAQIAVKELQKEQGRLAWSQFTRKYGKVRKIGPARRDKEAVHRAPQSTSELLWYRGLIARNFFDSPGGPQEFAYIPDDLLSLMPVTTEVAAAIYGRPARPAERNVVAKAGDLILDEACTLLASLRMGMDTKAVEEAEDWQTPPIVLMALLRAAGILDAKDHPNLEAVQEFLEADRGVVLKQLVSIWLSSEDFNELRLLPGIRAEGKWENEALHSRHFLLGILRALPKGNWWNLASLVSDVKERRADFQRPSGDYDSWYLVDEESGEYLRGFEYWERVDGALIEFLIRGPLHWLGILDLAAGEKGEDGKSFRFSGWAMDLLSGKAPKRPRPDQEKLIIDSQGQIQASRFVPRAVRYQVARFCSWEKPKKGIYRYRLEAESLQKAQLAGLDIAQLLKLLKSNASTDIAPNLLQALKRWENEGTQAKMKEMIVLRVNSAEMLKALRDSRAARYLGEPLGPNAIEVKTGAREHVMRVLTELGYLGEFQEMED